MTTTKIKFEPNLELIQLAEEFSANYKKFPTGEKYLSGNDTYTILYLDEFTGGQTYNISRIEKRTGVIEVNKEYIDRLDVDSDFLYFAIIWTAIFWWNNFQDDSFTERDADMATLKHYATTGKSRQSVLVGIKKQFEYNPTGANVERYNQLRNQI